MRQLTFVEPGVVEWREVPEPKLEGPGEALVRPIVVANCDLDRMIIEGRFPVPGGFALGHEFIAEVVETGDEVATVRRGEHVVVPFQISCGVCERCRRGLTGSCTAVKRGSAYGLGPLGRGEWGGALSDLVRVPYADAMLVPVPGWIEPLALASASDNLPDAWRTVGPPLRQDPGAEVLILTRGYGSIPLYAAGMAAALGAARVDYVDTKPERLELARRLGANPVEGKAPAGRARYAVVVDATADPEGLVGAIRRTAPGGVCTSIGIYLQEVALPLLDMYTTGITFRTSRPDARPTLPAIIELIAEGRFRPQDVNSKVVPWDDAREAFLDIPTKLVITR
jgi:alcohol dehydrogenase